MDCAVDTIEATAAASTVQSTPGPLKTAAIVIGQPSGNAYPVVYSRLRSPEGHESATNPHRASSSRARPDDSAVLPDKYLSRVWSS